MRRVGLSIAVAALQGGDRVMVTHPDPLKVTDKTTYSLVLAGRAISIRTFRCLAENLTPIPDGLFGAEMSQTFKWTD